MMTVLVKWAAGLLPILLALPAELRAEEPRSIPLRLSAAEGVPPPLGWPVTTGVPFRDGQLTEDAIASLRVETDRGDAVPAQFEVRGRYPRSKNVRWLGVDFQLDPKAKEYRLITGGKPGVAQPAPPAHPRPVRIRKERHALVVETGELKAEIPVQGGILS